MDISLTVYVGPSHQDSYQIGDLIAVGALSGSGCCHPRFVLINIVDIPDNAPAIQLFKRAKLMLESSINIDYEQRSVRKRAWRINFALIPPATRAKILADKTASVTWTTAKEYLKRKLVTNELDHSSDSDINIDDGDI